MAFNRNVSTGGAVNIEKRDALRFPYQDSVLVMDGKVKPALCLDLSKKGVGLELPQPLTPGYEMDVAFLSGSIKVSVVVANCKPKSDGNGYRIGMKFDRGQKDLVNILMAIQGSYSS